MVRLLIADDDAGFRDSIRRVVERDPDTEVVGEAADGKEAVRLAHALHPSIVLMDISMPQMNGFEACRRLREADETKHIPIIMVTTRGEAASMGQRSAECKPAWAGAIPPGICAMKPEALRA